MRYFDFYEGSRKAMMEAKGEAKRWATRAAFGRDKFPSSALRAGLQVIRKGEIFDPRDKEHVFVIGVATWSEPELIALDKIVQRGRNLEIHVFDIDDFATSADVFKALPGVPIVRHTPVLAEYESGSLSYFCQGAEALARLETI